jgi:VWFA-related protein
MTLLLPLGPIASQETGAEDTRPADQTRSTAGADTRDGFFTEVVDVRVINVEVFVTDRSGVPVVGLGPDSFELEVDGKPMPISNFYSEGGSQTRESVTVGERRSDPSFRSQEQIAAEAGRRSYVVILIDHARLGANNRKRALRALRDAIDELGDEDLIAVVGVEGTLVFYSDFLFDRSAVDRIMEDALRVPPTSGINDAERRRIFGELARGMSGGILARTTLADEQSLQSRIQAYAAEEYARSVASLRQIELVISTLSGVPGRKSILYVGEGIPTRPGEGLYVEWRNRFGKGNPADNLGMPRIDFNTDYTRAIGHYDLSLLIDQLARASNRAGVTLYALDAEGDHGGAVRSALTEQGATSETLRVVEGNFREPLEAASKATGGRLLRSSGQLTEQLVKLLDDFEIFYSIGFTAPAEWEPGADHNIKVKVGDKGLVVRHRDEVALPAPDELEAGATLAALRYQTANNPLEIRAIPGTRIEREDGNTVLAVALEIPIANLEMIPQGDAMAGSLSIFVSTKDAKGDASRVQKIPFHLAIPAAMMDQARSDSAHYELPLVLRPGDQQVAIGIRDNVSSRFSAVRLDISQLSDAL